MIWRPEFIGLPSWREMLSEHFKNQREKLPMMLSSHLMSNHSSSMHQGGVSPREELVQDRGPGHGGAGHQTQQAGQDGQDHGE